MLVLTLGPYTSTGVSAFHEVPNALQNLTWNFHSLLSENKVSKLCCILLSWFLKGRNVLNFYLCTIFLDSIAVHLTSPEAFEHGRCLCYLALSHRPSSVRNWRFVSGVCVVIVLVKVWKGIRFGVALQPCNSKLFWQRAQSDILINILLLIHICMDHMCGHTHRALISLLVLDLCDVLLSHLLKQHWSYRFSFKCYYFYAKYQFATWELMLGVIFELQVLSHWFSNGVTNILN